MHADLAVVDEAALALVNELDGILDGQDVVVPVLVRVVNHRGQRSGFAGAGGAGDEHEALVHHRELAQHGGQRRIELLEVLEGQHLAGNLAEHGGASVFLVEEVGAEAGDVRDFVAEVHIAGFLELLRFDFRRDLVKHRLERVALQRRVVHAAHLPADA